MLPIAAYLLDEEGRILHFNQVAAEVWGRSPKLNDFEDRYCGAFRVYNLDGSEISFRQGKGLAGGALRDGIHVSGREVIIERPDGSRIFCRIHVTPLRNSDGKIYGAAVYGWDSTRDHPNDHAMLADDLFFRTDRIGRYEYHVQTDRMIWSDTMLEFHDLQREEFQEHGGFALSFVHPDDREKFLNETGKMRRNQVPLPIQLRIISKKNIERTLWFSFEVEWDSSGKPSRRIGTVRDISSLVKWQKKLQDSSQRLKLLAEASFEGMLIAEDHIIVDCNEQLSKMFGYRRQELLGRESTVILKLEDRLRLERNLELHSNEPVECEGRRSDGSVIAFELRGRTMRIDGRLVLIKVVRDMTERKTAEEQLKQLHSEIWRMDRIRTLGQMAAGLAHELNQPLAAILNYATISAERAEQGGIPPEKLKSVFEKIALQANRAGSIIGSLRSLVRSRSAVRTSVDINAAVVETLRLMSFELRLGKITVQTDLDPVSPKVIGDDVQIKQVLVNLINNAIQAMQGEHSKGKILRLISGTHQDVVRLEIVDQGVGMPDGRHVSLFQPFFSTKPDGLGMGLSICQAILADLGGTLSSSQNPYSGYGTVMTVQFRAVKEHPEGLAQSS